MLLDLLLPVFVVLVFLPQLLPFVDCRTACTKCRQGGDRIEVLEVYCTMCAECQSQITKKQYTPDGNPRMRQGPVRFPGEDVKDVLKTRLIEKWRHGKKPFGDFNEIFNANYYYTLALFLFHIIFFFRIHKQRCSKCTPWSRLP